jgi:hypothetical protein
MSNLKIKNQYYTELLEWLMTNLILPFFIPFLFAFLLTFIVKIEFKENLFITLFENGVYIFLGITLFLSVFQDYKDATSVFSPLLYSIFFLHLMMIGFLFISSLNLIDSDVAIKFKENTWNSILVSISCIFIATYTKYKVIKQKIDKHYF